MLSAIWAITSVVEGLCRAHTGDLFPLLEDRFGWRPGISVGDISLSFLLSLARTSEDLPVATSLVVPTFEASRNGR